MSQIWINSRLALFDAYSKTRFNSITLFGEVYSNGVPILVAMQLMPQSKTGRVMNFAKVSSAYGRNNIQNLLDTSDILYIDPNKNRTDAWLSAIGVQFPVGLTEYGSISKVTYHNNAVNNDSPKTAMREAFDRAKKNPDSDATKLSLKRDSDVKKIKNRVASYSDFNHSQGLLQIGEKSPQLPNATSVPKTKVPPKAGAVNKDDVKFSTKLDSDGTLLTKEQDNFYKNSKVRDEEGNLLVVYHGTEAEFTVFDRSKGRANMDIQGSFFSPWELDAKGYGRNVIPYYLNITNPANEAEAYKALNRFKGQDYAGKRAAEYLMSKGYDGVKGDDELIAFYPDQIKSIGNLNPTTDPDIRFSLKRDSEGYVKQYNTRKEIMTQIGKYYKNNKDGGLDVAADALTDLKIKEESNISSVRGKVGRFRVADGRATKRTDFSGAGRLVGKRCSDELIDTGRVNLTGITIKSVKDFATIAQVYRDPRFETFRIFFTKGNKIVGQRSVSSRLPSLAKTFVEKDGNAFVNDFKNRMRRLDADGYYMLHNHPAGTPTPSDADMNVTTMISKLVPGFKHHIIINSNRYTDISRKPKGDFLVKQDLPLELGEDILYRGDTSCPFIGLRLNDPITLAKISKQVQIDDNNMAVAFFVTGGSYSNPNGLTIQAVMELDTRFMQKDPLTFKRFVVNRMREYGGDRLFVVANKNAQPEINGFIHQGLIMDAFIFDGDDFSVIQKGEAGAPMDKWAKKYEDQVFLERTPKPKYSLKRGMESGLHRERVKRELKENGEYQEIIKELEDVIITDDPIIEHISKRIKDHKGFTLGMKDVYRNMRDAFGENYPIIKEKYLDPFDESKMDYVGTIKRHTDIIYNDITKGLGIQKNSKESAAVQWIGEGKKQQGFEWREDKITGKKYKVIKLVDYNLDDLEKDFPDKWRDIVKASEIVRKQYDELIDEVNESRRKIYPNNKSKIVLKRKDYFRHYREMSSSFEGLWNVFASPANIDPKLAGISEFTKPKSKWASFMQERGQGKYKEDAIGGFLDYIGPAAYAINIDPHIKEFRGLAKQIAEATVDTKNANDTIAFIHDFANSLAGKTVDWDRLFVKSFGRKPLIVLSTLNNRVKKTQILLNARSALSQLANIPLGIAKIKNPKHLLPGAGDALTSMLGKNAKVKGLYNRSQFISERYSHQLIDRFNNSWLKKPEKLASWLLEGADEIGTKFIWNSAYKSAVDKGIAHPVKYADDVTRALVAGRGIGEVPLIQQYKVFQMIAPFQLEVTNLWHVLGDMKREKDAPGILLVLLFNWLFNNIYEEIVGDRVLFDPIDAIAQSLRDGNSVGLTGGRLAGEVLSNLPAHNNMKMYDSPLIGIASANDPYFYEFRKQGIIGPNFILPVEWLKDAKSVISYYLPFTKEIRDSNRKPGLPSQEWISARIDGESFNNQVRIFLINLLNELNAKAVAPCIDTRFQVEENISNWSERHVAFTAGIGTFGLHRALITEKGSAGRIGSVITTLELKPTQRKYKRHDEYCLYLTAGKCGACMRRCPPLAITDKGKDNQICDEYIGRGNPFKMGTAIWLR